MLFPLHDDGEEAALNKLYFGGFTMKNKENNVNEEYESFWGVIERLPEDGSGFYIESCNVYTSFNELFESYNSLISKGYMPRYPKASGTGYSIKLSNDLSMCTITLELDKLRSNESRYKILDMISSFMEENAFDD